MATHAYRSRKPAAARRRNITAEEFMLMLPQHPFYELYDGVLKVHEPCGMQSASAAMELATLLNIHVRQNQLGRVFGPDLGCVIRRGPDTVLGPDVSFVRRARLAYTNSPEKFFEGAPDLAVEVFSPTDRLIALQRKIERYIEAGTSLAWIIYPRKRIAMVYRKDGTSTIVAADGTLDGESVVPGFTCSLAEILAF